MKHVHRTPYIVHSYGIPIPRHLNVMNRNKILQSNLLDIIFDNRNKEYGAYVLRRDYDSRLGKALLTMLSAVVVFAVWIYFRPVPSINYTNNIPPGFDLQAM